MKGFDMAGGVTLKAFWEYAPYGRPQLYPPLLHILMLFLLKIGFTEIFIARFTSFIMFPLTLIIIWYVIRDIFDKETAFYSVVILGSLSYFFWQSAVTSAASLAQIIGIILFYSIEKNKKIAVPILMTFMLYSHLVIPHLYVLSFLVYSLFRKQRKKIILISLAISYILFLPWLLHIALNLNYLNPGSGHPNSISSIHLLLWLFAGFGIYFSIKKKGKYLYPFFLLLSLIPIAFSSYTDRFWNAHSFIPLSILAGIGVASLRRWSEKNLKPVFHKSSIKFIRTTILALLLASILFNPFLAIGKEKIKLSSSPSTLISLIKANERGVLVRWRGGTLLNKENVALAEFIKKNTQPDETIFIQNENGSLSDLITAYSGRFVSSGMLHEVKPYKIPKPTECSILIVPNRAQNIPSILKKNFYKIGDTPEYTILRNKMNTEKVDVEKPVVPYMICFILIFLAIILIIYDFSKKNKKKFRNILIFLLIFMLFTLTLSLYNSSVELPQGIPQPLQGNKPPQGIHPKGRH